MKSARKRCLPSALARQGGGLVLLTALACQSGWAADTQADADNGYDLYTHLRTLSYSDAETLAHTYDDARAGSAKGGDLVFTHNRVELGVARGDWHIGAFWRTDYRLEFNDDTAQFLQQQNDHVALPQGRHYALQVDGNHVTAMGLVVGKRFDAGRWSIDARMHLLRATDMLDGRVDAQLTISDPAARDASAFAGVGRINYAYNKDELLDRPRAFAGAGYGIGFDINVAAQLAERWHVSARLEDAPTLIYWQQLPFTDVSLTLARPRFAADGTLDTQPLATGREYKRSHLQRLPMRYDVQASRSLSPELTAFVRVRGFDEALFPQLGLRWQASPRWQFALSVDMRARALVLGFGSTHAHAEIALDDPRPGQAHMAAATLSAATSASALPPN